MAEKKQEAGLVEPRMPTYTTWAPFQIRSDVKELLDAVRRRDFPQARSYSDVIHSLIDEHNALKTPNPRR